MGQFPIVTHLLLCYTEITTNFNLGTLEPGTMLVCAHNGGAMQRELEAKYYD